jgi:hypothetical protein
MEQQVAEAQRREREERSERVRERERHETEIARPLREALAAQTKLAADLKTENDYLRNRVKELNRLLGAFQSVIAP